MTRTRRNRTPTVRGLLRALRPRPHRPMRIPMTLTPRLTLSRTPSRTQGMGLSLPRRRRRNRRPSRTRTMLRLRRRRLRLRRPRRAMLSSGRATRRMSSPRGSPSPMRTRNPKPMVLSPTPILIPSPRLLRALPSLWTMPVRASLLPSPKSPRLRMRPRWSRKLLSRRLR